MSTNMQYRNNMIPLALLNGRLGELTGTVPPGYSRLLRAALDGVLPATRTRGRWFVDEADLEAAAGALGMVVPAKPASRPSEPAPADIGP